VSGFLIAALLALGIHVFHGAARWWPVGRKAVGVLLVFGVVGATVLGAEHFSSSGESLRAVLFGR